MDLEKLAPGLVTVVLALFGGAGGSLLLDMWWKPRRVRRRVAALLMHEVNVNTQAMAVHTYLREQHPRQVSADFRLSRLGFDAVASEIAELPPQVASDVIVLYHHFEHLHVLREAFSRTHAAWRAAEATGQGEIEKVKRYCLAALDGFNVNLDETLTEARAVFALLRQHAPRQPWRQVSDAELREKVAAHEQDRRARLEGLAKMRP
jgi:hypothetical protein